MKKIKICMMARLTTAHSKGGMEIHTKILCEELAKMGLEVHLIAPSYDGKKHNIVENGVNIHYVDCKPPRFFWNPIWSSKAYKKFIELDKKIKFDVFHSQASGGLPVLLHSKHRNCIKYIVTLHGTIIDSLRSHFFEFLFEKSFKSFIKFIFYSFLEICIQPVFFVCFRKCDKIIATSNFQIKNIKKVYRIKNNKITLIRNGINTNLFSPKNRDNKIEKKIKVNRKEKIIFWVGRMDKQKGPQIAIKGMKELIKQFPEAKLYIIGNKEGCFNELVKLVKKLSLEKNVIFIDNIKYEELPKYINACDIYIHPTLRDEAAPLVLPQAIACGKPIVASKIGGNVDVVIDGVNGFLFKIGDIDDFCEKVIKLLKDGKLMKKMCKDARKIAIQKFNSKKMCKKYYFIYKNLN